MPSPIFSNLPLLTPIIKNSGTEDFFHGTNIFFIFPVFFLIKIEKPLLRQK